jgi:molybdenum cofactor biosynthesis enzyme
MSLITNRHIEPLVIPYCASCKIMCERFTILPSSDSFRIRMEVQCHGQTTGAEFPAVEAIKKKHVIVKFARKAFNAVNVQGAPRPNPTRHG